MGDEDRPHAVRLLVIWAVLSIVGILVVLQVHIPPGDQSTQGADQSATMSLMSVLALPVFMAVVVLILYSVVFFRRRPGELVDGPPMQGNTPVQIAWVAISSLLVLVLAIVGIAALANAGAASASAGQSTAGTAAQPGNVLRVQVIAQQWFFTYRYPDYGGVETDHLMLPVNTPIELHVTSLDIIHSFWAYQLGVKVDANPGVDNVAQVSPQKEGSFQVRCAELCGIWHGHMADSSGAVVSQQAFQTWIAQQQADFAEIQQYLPKYAPFYFPEPLTKGS